MVGADAIDVGFIRGGLVVVVVVAAVFPPCAADLGPVIAGLAFVSVCDFVIVSGDFGFAVTGLGRGYTGFLSAVCASLFVSFERLGVLAVAGFSGDVSIAGLEIVVLASCVAAVAGVVVTFTS